MKILKLAHFYTLIILMTFAVLFSTSCKKDDSVKPNYVGTWVIAYPTEAEEMPMKETLTLTETSFTDLWQMKTAENKWTNFVSVKGALSVSGNIATITVNEVGQSTIDMVTELPTGTLSIYKAGDEGFNDFLINNSCYATWKIELV